MLRVLLPTVAATLIGLVLLWPQLAPQEDRFRIGFADLEITDDGLTMIRPRYVGSDERSRPFSIAAHSVRNMVPGGEEVLLDKPEAEITLEDGTWVSLEAESGTYRVNEKMLNLAGDVRVFHDQGYALETREAVVNLESQDVISRTPVEGQGPAGFVQGTGFRVMDGGSRIYIDGPARMTINPSAGNR